MPLRPYALILMHRSSALLWWHSGILTKKRYDALKERFGSLDVPLALMNEELLRELRVKPDILASTLRRFAVRPDEIEDKLKRLGVGLISLEDKSYPSMLREIGDAPVFLSYRGDLSVTHNPCIGLVGTRLMSPYGQSVTSRFTADFVRSGFATVSGLAFGVDTQVAEETLKAGGKTVAVLGHGLSMISPVENTQLAERIVEQGGLLLSEYALDQQGTNYTFPGRNRIIAGLSKGTVVLEAPLGSGAIITADLALDYGRDVFAVPGQIFDANYAGSHELIAKGHAKLVSSAAEVLRELGAAAAPEEAINRYEPASEEEAVIYGLLSSMAKPADALVIESGLSAAAVGTVLTMLELAGAAKNIGGNQWIRY
jgi:DNA processing protein